MSEKSETVQSHKPVTPVTIAAGIVLGVVALVVLGVVLLVGVGFVATVTTPDKSKESTFIEVKPKK